MVNHPNRKPGTVGRNPTPEEVREFRRSHDLSTADCAALLHTVARVWAQWESGERRMHPAFWELVHLKANTLPLRSVVP